MNLNKLTGWCDMFLEEILESGEDFTSTLRLTILGWVFFFFVSGIVFFHHQIIVIHPCD